MTKLKIEIVDTNSIRPETVSSNLCLFRPLSSQGGAQLGVHFYWQVLSFNIFLYIEMALLRTYSGSKCNCLYTEDFKLNQAQLSLNVLYRGRWSGFEPRTHRWRCCCPATGCTTWAWSSANLHRFSCLGLSGSAMMPEPSKDLEGVENKIFSLPRRGSSVGWASIKRSHWFGVTLLTRVRILAVPTGQQHRNKLSSIWSGYYLNGRLLESSYCCICSDINAT